MKITHKDGNLIDGLFNGEVDYIIHQTNCQGCFKSGIAGEIRKRIPEAYEAYMKRYQLFKDRGFDNIALGDLSLGGKVINMSSQLNYGYKGKRYTNYGAMADGLMQVFHLLMDYEYAAVNEVTIGLPHGMGSVLGGGDWEIVLELIEHCLAPYVKEVVIYKL